MSKIITAITEWFRSLLWSIAEIFLFLLDSLWKIVLKIGTLNIGGSTVTTKFFTVMSICMLLFIVFKLVKIYIKFFIDSDYRERINLSKVLISLSIAVTLISGLPLGYKIICNISSEAIEHVNYWIPSDFLPDYQSADEINMSDVLIQSGRVNLSNREDDIGEEIKLDEEFDINATYDRSDYLDEFFNNLTTLDEESMSSENALDMMNSIAGIIGLGSKTYKYFPTWSSIILEILLSIVALYIFALTAIQIAMRSIICSMKYLLAPYMVASIIDPEDNSFGTWLRSIGGDLIANFCQIYFTYFVLILCSNSSIQSALGNDWVGIFSKIALFIGGLLAVQEIPNVISQFFGSSGQSMMETMRGTMMMGSMLSMTGKGALKGGIMAAGAVRSTIDKAGNMKESYLKGGGGVEGMKRAGKDFAKSMKDKFDDSVTSQNKKNDHVFNDEERSFSKEGHQDGQKYQYSQPSKNKNSFKQNENKKTSSPESDSYQSEDKRQRQDHINPDYQKDDDYDMYLNAARYYGIEDADKMTKDELKEALSQKGYKYSSMKNYKSSFNSDAYKTNMQNVKNKKKGKKDK